MNRTESYDDPVLANRVRAWMETQAPAAAPERLVFSVMDDVERSPRRRPWLASRPIVWSLVRYAALTLVITIGVAGGILLTRSLPNVGPSAPPSPTGPVPSLRSLGGLDTNGRILAAGRNGAWLATASGQLIPIDAATAALGEPVQIGFVPTDVAVSASAGTSGGEMVWLVGPENSLLRLDPSVGELFAATDAAGSRVAVGAGAAWVGRDGAVLQVSADFLTSVGTFDLPGHRATDPLVVVGTTLWVAGATGIDRIDASSGAHASRVEVTARALVDSGRLVWATAGDSLVGIDEGSGEVAKTAALPSGVYGIDALVTHGDIVWLAATGPEAPLLVGVDPTSGQPISLTQLATPPISIAAVGNQVWTLDSGGHIDRYGPGS